MIRVSFIGPLHTDHFIPTNTLTMKSLPNLTKNNGLFYVAIVAMLVAGAVYILRTHDFDAGVRIIRAGSGR